VCRNYDGGPCEQDGCDGRITCHDFNDRRCADHSVNGRMSDVLFDEDEDEPTTDAGQRFLERLRDDPTASKHVREVAQEVLDEAQPGLIGVERRLNNMCTHAVLGGWRWWRPSWSVGYHAGLEAAWRVAFEQLYGEEPRP
jgi:hypothetical protein